MNRLQGKRASSRAAPPALDWRRAKRFVEEGARVAVTGTNPKNAGAGAQRAGQRRAGNRLGRQQRCLRRKPLAQAGAEGFRRRSIFSFVNAGIVDMRPIEQIDEAAFDRSMGLNLKGPILPGSRAAAGIRESGFHRVERLSERAHRHAEYHDLRGYQGGAALDDPHAVGRAEVARHPGECRQPWSYGDPALQQAGLLRSGAEERRVCRFRARCPPDASRSRVRSPMPSCTWRRTNRRLLWVARS